MNERLLSTFENMRDSTIEYAPVVMVAVVVFFLFLLAASVLSKGLIRIGKETRLDDTLAVLLARLGHTALTFFGLLVAAVIALPNFRPVDMLAGLGVASIAVGFALKEILQNFFAGVLILWRKPFLLGDEINTGAYKGTVEDINIRAIRLRTYSGTLAVIPNSQIFGNPVEVITGLSQRRVELVVGIGYSDSMAKAKSLILNYLETLPEIERPKVYITELAPSSVNIKVHFWTQAHQLNVLNVTDKALEGIKDTLDQAGIDIPYPHNVVQFHNVNLKENV
ncbi:mechanosensitive ion channel family protein [Candidatus Obscuribacterales bacterium]|nr:mechanosensitive ion channel family protein [Candidatus Obscuribacterales bacterium]